MTTSKPASKPVDTSFLAQYAETYRFWLGRPAGMTFLPDGTLLFQRSGPRSFTRDLYALSADGKESVFLTAQQVLAGAEETLSEEEKARRERTRTAARGITSYSVSRDGKTVIVPLSGKLFAVDVATKKVRELGEGAKGYPIDPRLSPDGKKLACVRDGHVHVIDVASGKDQRMTPDKADHETWGSAEFVAQEEMGRMKGYWWAPDSSALLVQHADESKVETLHIVDPMHPEKVPADFRYPRAGTTNATVKLALLPVGGGKPTWIAWDRKRWEYLVNVVWSDEAGAVPTVVVQDRRQRELVMLGADLKTGKTTTLHAENDAAWVNIEQSVPVWLDADNGGGFLWLTERNGWPQLERRKADGTEPKALTKPGVTVKAVLGVEAKAKRAWLSVGTQEDPTSTHVATVPLGGGELTLVTKVGGRHGAVVDDATGRHVVIQHDEEGNASWSVRGADGKEVAQVASKAEKAPMKANVEWLTVDDKAPEGPLHAAVIRPRTFDANTKYPVLLHVYGGPHAQMVTRARSGYLLDQWFADLGYVVLRIDGRGTPSRGRDWERSIYGNFIAKPMADQVRGLKALGAKFEELDLTRVGIYGWSFGGYFSAMAVMQHPEVFHAGIAGAPVCAWEDYDTHYTERYIGHPKTDPKAYEVSNVLSYVDKLGSPLLIMHGTADDNVYFTHAVKMSNALFRAGKDHEFLPLSGFTHMVPDPNVTTRLYMRYVTFFEENVKQRGR